METLGTDWKLNPNRFAKDLNYKSQASTLP